MIFILFTKSRLPTLKDYFMSLNNNRPSIPSPSTSVLLTMYVVGIKIALNAAVTPRATG